MDADPAALAIARKRLEIFGERARLVQANFSKMAQVARENNFVPVNGVLLDLGVSSMQLDNPERGFSFQGEGPLDMRFGEVQGELTAADIIKKWPEEKLVELFFKLGEEPESRRFARAIMEARKQTPFTTTLQLAKVLEKAGGGRAAGRSKKPIHPATRVFQALRMAVNRELENLEEGLKGAV